MATKRAFTFGPACLSIIQNPSNGEGVLEWEMEVGTRLDILVEGQTAESAGEVPSVGGEHEYLYSNSPLHLAAIASRYTFPPFFSSKVTFKSFKRVTKRGRNMLSSVSEFLKILHHVG